MCVTHDFPFGDLRIPVEIRGEGARPLLFLPGMGAHPRYYRKGIARLAAHHTVVVPDLSFRSHARLPRTAKAYLRLVEALATRYAPLGPVAGHSFGGLLALLSSRPAIALSPTVPLPSGWATSIVRAVQLQLREYAGFEGQAGIAWAWSIMCDYVGTAIRRPNCLFPAISDTLAAGPGDLTPASPSSVLVLARYDTLYRPGEYETYIAGVTTARPAVRWVERGHDWPVTDPRLLEREILSAVEALSTVAA